MNGWLALAAALALAGSYALGRDHGVDAEAARHKLAASGEVQQARAVEQKQAATIQVEVEKTHATIAAIPDARPELDRLRDDNARLKRQLSDSAAAAKRGETATQAGMVYGELLDRANARIAGLERLVGRAVELGARYDESHARGELCVAIEATRR